MHHCASIQRAARHVDLAAQQRVVLEVQRHAVGVFGSQDGGHRAGAGIAAREGLGRHRAGDDLACFAVTVALAAGVFEAHMLQDRHLARDDVELLAGFFSHPVQMGTKRATPCWLRQTVFLECSVYDQRAL
jgi:hypothetical protein